MPQFDRELVARMRAALDDVMSKVPAEISCDQSLSRRMHSQSRGTGPHKLQRTDGRRDRSHSNHHDDAFMRARGDACSWLLENGLAAFG
jgi:hypothetical protein